MAFPRDDFHSRIAS